MKKFIILILLTLFSTSLFSEDKNITNKFGSAQIQILNFPIYAGSIDCIPMKQALDLYSSSYKLFTKAYFKAFPLDENKLKNFLIIFPPALLTTLFFTPLTHEEAHRSILTNKKIGSISQPFFNKNLAAYVKGVKDYELIGLRDTDFSSFIRLHTAGIESDYCLMQTDFENLVFNGQNNIDGFLEDGIDYIGRFSSIFSYLFILPNIFFIDSEKFLTEETDELKRDIVGHDVYGMIHHLYNPHAEYHRYWDPCDFSKEELSFAKRIGFLNLFNIPLISPILFNKFHFSIGEYHIISFNTGYALAPFGDFIDERFYYGYYGGISPVRISLYIREYGNKERFFPAFGIKLIQYSFFDWLTINIEGHFWIQPENLDFNTKKGRPGGAFSSTLMFIPQDQELIFGKFGLYLEFLIKSKGFLPEIESHDFYWQLTTGISFKLN